MIICYHDGRRQLLSHDLTTVILQGKDNLEPELFVVVTTVAGDSHWYIDQHRSRIRRVLWSLQLLDLIRVENDYPLRLVTLPLVVFTGPVVLFAVGSLLFASDTAWTDANLATILCLVIGRSPTSLGRVCSPRPSFLFQAGFGHSAATDKLRRKLKSIGSTIRSWLGQELGF